MKDFNIDEYREKLKKRRYFRRYYRNNVALNPKIVRYRTKEQKENRKNFSIKRSTLLPTEQEVNKTEGS